MYEIKEADGSITLTGERLKFYYDEHRDFADEYALELDKHRARLILKKLERHFKVRVWLCWGTGHSAHYYWNGAIRLPIKGASLGLLCHEIAHSIHHQKYHKRGHTKQLRRILTRVVKYCRKKDYWLNSQPANQSCLVAPQQIG